MEKIESINLHVMRNNEHFQFMTDLNTLIADYKAGELNLGPLLASFKKCLEAEDVALRVEQGSQKSKTLEQLDEQRDKTWKAILTRVKSVLLSPIEAEIESAQLVKRNLDLYGEISTLPYNEASAALTNLVTDLQLPANEPILEKLGISSWVTELKNQNEKFKTMFNERNAEYAGRPSGDVRQYRRETDLVYNDIVEKINASVVLQVAKPGVSTFISELNEKIKYYKTAMAIRNSRGKDKNNGETGDKAAA
jgi:hypothetical protein